LLNMFSEEFDHVCFTDAKNPSSYWLFEACIGDAHGNHILHYIRAKMQVDLPPVDIIQFLPIQTKVSSF
jgi:hypothetical protein